MSMASLLSSPYGVEGSPSEEASQSSGHAVRAAIGAMALTFFGVLDAASAEPPTNAVQPDPRVQKWVQDMNRSTFADRETAMNAAREALRERFDERHDPDALLREMRAAVDGVLTRAPEPYARVRQLETELLHWRNTSPQTVPALGTLRGDTLFQHIQRTALAPISIVDDAMPALAARDFHVPKERAKRFINHFLAQMANETRTVPRSMPDGSVRLSPAIPGQYVAATPDLLATVTEFPEVGKRTVELAFESGRGTIVALLNEHGEYAPCSTFMGIPCAPQAPEEALVKTDPTTTMQIADSGRRQWIAFTGDQPRQLSIDRPLAPTFDAIVACHPESVTIGFGKTAEKVGFQHITTTPVRQENGEWTFKIISTVCGEIPWPATPLSWDMLSYASAHANRYVPRDAEQKEMSAVITRTGFHMRTMTVAMSCPREPVSMTVHAYGSLEPRTLAMPELRPVIPVPQPPLR